MELAVLIGTEAKNIDANNALDHVTGYAVALDLTLRDIQNAQKEKGLPWEIAKAFDTACPLSAFVPADQIGDPQNLEIKLSINGELRQNGNTGDMMRSVAELIAASSTYFTLEEGDIVLTGTPSGVGRIVSGDRLEAMVEKVGRFECERCLTFFQSTSYGGKSFFIPCVFALKFFSFSRSPSREPQTGFNQPGSAIFRPGKL